MLLLQTGNQVAIDFDDVQVIDTLQQRLGNRPQAGADFDHRIATLRIDGRDNGGNDAAIDQEVLAEAFAGDVAFHAVFLSYSASSWASQNENAGFVFLA